MFIEVLKIFIGNEKHIFKTYVSINIPKNAYNVKGLNIKCALYEKMT